MHGKMEWLLLDDQYDYKSEIQSCGYADMLNDTDRNNKYYNALHKVINEMKSIGKTVHVLDIGCGSGILSMMALKLGADKVTACESFEPMYKCAHRVFSDNFLLADKIDLVNSSSFNLKVGINMTERANVLVSEIFDSQLIGEGVLPVFEHALTHLLTEDARIIPCGARMMLQPIESRLLNDHNRLRENTKYSSRLPASFFNCSGYNSGYDFQASSLIDDDSFKLLSSVTMINEIDFREICLNNNHRRTSLTIIEEDDCLPRKIETGKTIFISRNSKIDALIFWWELIMVEGGSKEEVISTAPRWASSQSSEYQWRDHWLQVALFPRCDMTLRKNTSFRLLHDSHDIWLSNSDNQSTEKPCCTCGIHLHISRSRLCQLNSTEYNTHIEYVAKQLYLENVKTCVVVSDFSFLPLSLADRGILSYNIIESDSLRELTKTFLSSASSKLIFTSLDSFSEVSFDAVVGDPYFVCSMLPWDDVHFWYAVEKVRRQTSAPLFISPRKMCLQIMLVEFENLHKINAAVGRVKDFNLRAFDEITQRYDCKDDDELQFESKFLWEYDSYARSSIGNMITIDLTSSITELIDCGTEELIGRHTFKFSQPITANGFVLWTTWEVADGVWIDNSLNTFQADHDNKISWKPIVRQAVHFFKESFLQSFNNQITIKCNFNLERADFKFTIDS